MEGGDASGQEMAQHDQFAAFGALSSLASIVTGQGGADGEPEREASGGQAGQAEDPDLKRGKGRAFPTAQRQAHVVPCNHAALYCQLYPLLQSCRHMLVRGSALCAATWLLCRP